MHAKNNFENHGKAHEILRQHQQSPYNIISVTSLYN